MRSFEEIAKREQPARWRAIDLISKGFSNTDADGALGAIIIGLGLVYVCIVGWVDLVTLKGLDLKFLYLLGCGWVGWKAGARASLAIALISGVFLWRDEVRAGTGSGTGFILLSNLVIRVAGFAAAGWLASTAGRLTRHLDRVVRRRTESLQKEVVKHRETALRWREMAQLFRQLTENINEVFWVSDPARTRLNYLSPAYERIWMQPCKAAYLNPVEWLEAVHKDDRERVVQAVDASRVAGGYNEEYRVVRPDGSVRWVHDRAFPVMDERHRLFRLVGIIEDITERKREEKLRAHLEAQILEISDREQARIGQDIHDGLCQQLVGAAFAANSLEQSLAAQGNPELPRASRIGRLLDEAMTESRRVARGLYPVRLSTKGLASALEDLAATASGCFKIPCAFRADGEEVTCSAATETHLYRIAQEAVNNAVRHSQASSIEILLGMAEGTIELKVSDNGKGIPATPDRDSGMGLHIMKYRARSIGAELRIMGGSNGTSVLCRVPAGET